MNAKIKAAWLLLVLLLCWGCGTSADTPTSPEVIPGEVWCVRSELYLRVIERYEGYAKVELIDGDRRWVTGQLAGQTREVPIMWFYSPDYVLVPDYKEGSL